MPNLVRVTNSGKAPEQPINFSYTGGIQSYVVPKKGIYQLEVWGSQGGSVGGHAGKGGYAKGNVNLKRNDIIYIVVGGTGGYNGGGNGGGSEYVDFDWKKVKYAPGGGATHIGKTNAVLANTSVANLLIVAGGGGGDAFISGTPGPSTGYGGDGGGTSGGTGSCSSNEGGYYSNANGGTQSTGYAYGRGGNSRGAKSENSACGGGGGGYYGGYGGYGEYSTNSCSGGGGGGSGYVGGCISGTTSMTSGSRSGNGYARITFIG